MFYLRRKQVGVLASAHCNNTYPKFNTPQRKVELANFAEKIAADCSVPAVGFNRDGIIKHIQDFFNEQRRHKKRKLVCDKYIFNLPELQLGSCRSTLAK